MKLIDLLVKELPERGGWPDGVTHIEQDYDRELMFYGRGDVRTGVILNELAIDHRKCGEVGEKITRDQYESALAASKAVVGHDGWIEWGGGECPVDSDAIVEVKCRWHNQHQYNNDRAGDFYWAHTGSNGDIIAYRLQQPVIGSRANDDRLEQDLNECIGQGVDAPEWNGEGLPPVGLICEGRFPRHPGISFEWQECLVLYVFERECAVKSKSTSTLHYCDEFRPLRTEADKKRDEAIQSMASVIDYRNGCSSKPLAGWLYDAIAEGKIPGVKLEGK